MTTDDLEDLLQFFYMCPVGLLEIGDTGDVHRVNPAAARMLVPELRDGENLTNVWDVLTRLCPDLVTSITVRPDRTGPLSVGQRILLDPRTRNGSTAELRAVRVAADRVMIVLIDVTEEIRLARQINEVGARMRDVVAATLAYRQAAAAALNVSTTAVTTLEELLNRGPRTPSALARALGLSGTRMTGILDELEAAGFVDRVPNPRDRRSWLIVFTPRGRDRVGPLLDLLTGGIDRIVAARTAAHDHDIGSVLSTVASALRRRTVRRPQPARTTAAGLS